MKRAGLRLSVILSGGLLAATAALPVQAHPGQLEINQACAASGCFPGDAPGLPVTLPARGSYRLTGNLAGSDRGAIEILASDVRLDLGGFVVSCTARGTSALELGGTLAAVGTTQASTEPPGVPVPGSEACAADVDGIAGAGDNIHISHGTVRGFGDAGIDLDGRGARIVDVTAVGNGGRGIDLQFHDHAVVRDSAALDNGQTGIILGDGGMIRDCVAGNNGGGALLVSQGSQIRDSVSRGNHNGASTGFYGLIHGLVSTENNFGFSPGLNAGHGLNVAGDNAVSDNSGPQDRLDCEAVGNAVVCP